jgi:hypothetical protein
MKVKDFKTWFAGLTAGMVEGHLFNIAQIKALKEAINELDDPEDLKATAPSGDGSKGGNPAPSPVPTFDKEPTDIGELLRKEFEKRGPRTPTPPFGGPKYDPFPWHNPEPYWPRSISDKFSPGTVICSSDELRQLDKVIGDIERIIDINASSYKRH